MDSHFGNRMRVAMVSETYPPEVNGVAYINCGDWVDSCTAIVEHLNGSMELVRWGGAEPRLN